MKQYLYVPDFLIKKLKGTNLKIYKNNFIEINDNSFELLELEINKSLKNIPKLNFKDNEELEILLKKVTTDEDFIKEFETKILNKRFSNFIKKPKNIDELILVTISLTLKDIYIQNKNKLLLDNLGGFESFYKKKESDLIILNVFLEKYLIMIKRVILQEELSFIKEIETKTENLNKTDLIETKNIYNSIIRLTEEFRIQVENLNLDFPEIRKKLIRGHKITKKTKPIITLSKNIENNNLKIIEELKIIASNARKRKEFILKELDEKHINWTKIKKKFIEQKILRLN